MRKRNFIVFLLVAVVMLGALIAVSASTPTPVYGMDEASLREYTATEVPIAEDDVVDICDMPADETSN